VVDLVEKPNEAPTIAAVYHKMGELITHNADQQFGGAFVLTPPGGGSLESLFISEASPALFWATLKTIIEQQLAGIDEAQLRGRQGFGR
jgi:hypothetical protein